MASITPLFDDARTTYLWGAKGGVGTSTVAALHALALARAGHPTTLVAASGDHGELAAILGMPEGSGPVDANAAAGVAAGERSRVVVVDGGCDPALERAVSRRLVVVRLCYLALRRALATGMAGTDGVVVVVEAERSLGVDDVEAVLGRPVVARVAVTAAMARLLDAGLLALRPPRLDLSGMEPASSA